MTPTPDRSARAALLLVRLAALWILAGALFKLFVGSPNDLPPMVREFPLSATLTFKLAIAVELSIALPALLRPARLWPLVAAQLAVFCAILVPLIASGAKSCGCFGSKVPMPPWLMLAIDGSLLVALLATRPWRVRAEGAKLLVPIAGALLFAWIAPFTLIDTDLAPVAAAPGGSAAGANAAANGGKAALPRFVEWEPENWVGKPLREIPLAALTNVELLPQDATWVLYSPTCDHCAAYLRRLEGEFAQAPQMYVFVQLPGEPGVSRTVDLMPPGEEIVLPTEVNYVLTPPWALTVEGGVVTAAVHPED